MRIYSREAKAFKMDLLIECLIGVLRAEYTSDANLPVFT